MIDRLQRFPNQNIQNRPDACTAETISDIWGNVQNQPYTPDFTLGATFHVLGQEPSSGGTDPYSAMLSAVIYGCLPTEDDPTDVSTSSELMAANWTNYTPQDIHLASLFPARGVNTYLDVNTAYADICDYLDESKQGVSLAMIWSQSFMSPNADGTLPVPSGATSNHNVAVYGYDSRGLMIKAWLGPTFGLGGYVYVPEVMFPQVFQGAWSFNSNSWRWGSLAWACATHYWLYPDIRPMLISGN